MGGAGGAATGKAWVASFMAGSSTRVGSIGSGGGAAGASAGVRRVPQLVQKAATPGRLVEQTGQVVVSLTVGASSPIHDRPSLPGGQGASAPTRYSLGCLDGCPGDQGLVPKLKRGRWQLPAAPLIDP